MTEIYCEFSDASFVYLSVPDGTSEEIGNAVREELKRRQFTVRLIGWRRKADREA